jgi:formate/nitrite transporter FocA (FNT family)
MTEAFDIILVALNQLVVQLVNILPKLVITIIIWYVGKYLIHIGVKIARKIDIKGTKIDNKIIDILTSVILIAGKIFLVLIILDYWSIGETIISAIVSGLTFTFAIAFGLAFGKALEPDAKTLVEKFRKKIEK